VEARSTKPMYSTIYTAKAGAEIRQRTLLTILISSKKSKQEKTGALDGALVFFLWWFKFKL
jgi:hypothetical protein